MFTEREAFKILDNVKNNVTVSFEDFKFEKDDIILADCTNSQLLKLTQADAECYFKCARESEDFDELPDYKILLFTLKLQGLEDNADIACIEVIRNNTQYSLS